MIPRAAARRAALTAQGMNHAASKRLRAQGRPYAPVDVRDLQGRIVTADACEYCGQRNTGHGGNLTAAHRVPLKEGGNHAAGNIAVVCEDCARAKGDRTEGEYLAWLTGVVERLTGGAL